MRIIAYYAHLDANVIRRVVGPLSVLSQRGKNVAYRHLALPDEMAQSSVDLVILPNWGWDGALPKIAGQYCYDLSDAALLSDEKVINVLGQCSAVMVPTKSLATLVQPFCSHTIVQPSTVHADWFFGIGQQRPKFPIVACVGDYDWSAVIDPLVESLKAHQQVMVATTNPELYQALPEKRRMFVGGNIEMYARLVRMAYLAIVPGERREHDPGPIHEFGLFGVPSLVGPAWSEDVRHGVNGLVVGSPQSFRRAFDLLTTKDTARTKLGAAAVIAARDHTAVRQADKWLAAVEKVCFTAAAASTL